MKTKFFVLIALVALTACNNNDKNEVAKLKTQVGEDSVALANSKQKDSTISAYIDIMNRIQEKLDSVRMHEKMLTVNKTEDNNGNGKPSIISDIQSIDDLIIHYNKEINQLSARLKKMERKDANLEKIVSDLNKQLTNKENELVELQSRLGQTSDSLKLLTTRFNDSLNVIKQQQGEITAMVNENNVVYYIVGTSKQLAKEGAIDKNGGFIGLGRTKAMDPNVNNSLFTKADKRNLSVIPLNGKFKSVITEHGGGSWRITKTGKSDTLLILQPNDFWSKSKYLVVTIK